MQYASAYLDLFEPIREKLQNRFILFSVITHIIGASMAVYIASQATRPEPELITIEIKSPEIKFEDKGIKKISPNLNLGMKTPQTIGAKSNRQEIVKNFKQSTPKLSQPKLQEIKVKNIPTDSTSNSVKTSSPAKLIPVKQAQSTVMPQKIQAIPATVSDLDSDMEQLEQSMNKVEKQIADSKVVNLNDDFNNEYSKIDEQSAEKIAQTKSVLTQDLDESAAQAEENLSGIERENAKFSNRLSQLKSKKSLEYENQVQSALAAEKAKEASRLAAQKALQGAQVQANSFGAAGGGETSGVGGNTLNDNTGGFSGADQGVGRGKLGANEYASDTVGNKTGIRSLEQLRQLPGNKKPNYDYQERLRGDQGVVVFLAYVNQQGNLIKFEQIKSTGHANLDKKTLDALKTWRFFPGQEGWVELPFKWDLTGGPKEMPTLLRVKGRNLSINSN